MSEPRPIVTAPKDGTVIDIWVNGQRVPSVKWNFSRDASGQPVEDCWMGWEHADRGWSGMGGGYPPMVQDGEKATHWAPITRLGGD